MPPPYNDHIIKYRDMQDVWVVFLSDLHRSHTCHMAVHVPHTWNLSKTGHALTFEPLELQICPRCQNRGFWGCWVDLDGSHTCHVAVHVSSTCQYTCNTIRFWAIDMYMLLHENSSILGHILSQYASFHECAVCDFQTCVSNRICTLVLPAFLMRKTSYQHPEATNTVQLNLILLTECPTWK